MKHDALKNKNDLFRECRHRKMVLNIINACTIFFFSSFCSSKNLVYRYMYKIDNYNYMRLKKAFACILNQKYKLAINFIKNDEFLWLNH